MKKVFLVLPVILMLLTVCTGCGGSKAPPDSGSSGEAAALAQYENILHSYKVYFVGFGEPSEDGLPMVGGTNTRPALADVLEKNDKESGELRGLLEEFTEKKSFEERLKLTYRIMELLVSADDIPDGDGLVSEKKIAALKAFWGPRADQDIIPPITSQQAQLIEQSYKYLVEHYCLSLLCSMYYDYTSRLYKGEREDGSTFPRLMSFSSRLSYDISDGLLDENAFYDICLGLGYYGTLRYENYEAYAEFRGYMEDEIIYNTWWWDEDDKRFLFFPLIDKALKDINDLLDGANDINVIFGSDGDDELVGGADNELIIGSGGNDILKGGAGNDYLQGGAGDDVYIIRPNCGDDVIYDSYGANVLRFDGIPLENIYIGSVYDDGREDDVKITFVGSSGSVTIRDYKYLWRERSFDIEIGGRRFAEDDPESPFMFIDDDSRLPQGIMPPTGR